MTSTNASRRFFEDLGRFGDALAIVDTTVAISLSYRELEARVVARIVDLEGPRGLVFIEAKNDIASIIDYIACLRAGHVVYLLEDLNASKVQELIALYKPNILIDVENGIVRSSPEAIDLHPDLLLLLSTSGSTGSPKFVKLSARNIDSNAQSIAEYLELTGSEKALQHLKPYYSYGLSIINSHLAVGSALILTHLGVNETEFWRVFNEHQATSFAGVPYTFESLKHLNFNPADYPSLRYATQAGGKLEAHLVQSFAAAFAANSKRFYVMYGQTEAAPRISYLPPALATRYPGSIGQSIPGGKLYIIDDKGQEIRTPETAGELAYEGPNVMMGYATSPAELATDETPARLLTGDIGVIREEGLIFITGRASRFVKPFGVRVNLDEVQSFVKLKHGTCAVTGSDKMIVVAFEGSETDPAKPSIAELSDRFGLAPHIFRIRPYNKLPLLPSGKYDFQRILLDETEKEDRTPPLMMRVFDGILSILGLKQGQFDSVEAVFHSILGDGKVDVEQSFQNLTLDSLSFVTLAVELEQLFGNKLPENWQEMPLKELEARYQHLVAEAVPA
jgi:acyl-coenzyme A synthetase/AMP-(fatty) acid ligase/acyl carrier protein